MLVVVNELSNKLAGIAKARVAVILVAGTCLEAPLKMLLIKLSDSLRINTSLPIVSVNLSVFYSDTWINKQIIEAYAEYSMFNSMFWGLVIKQCLLKIQAWLPTKYFKFCQYFCKLFRVLDETVNSLQYIWFHIHEKCAMECAVCGCDPVIIFHEINLTEYNPQNRA